MVNGDKYFDAAIKRAAKKIKKEGRVEVQISSSNGRYGITIFDDYYEAGEGTIIDASGLALEVMRTIEKTHKKTLVMQKTQADVSKESLTGIMSIVITEDDYG